MGEKEQRGRVFCCGTARGAEVARVVGAGLKTCLAEPPLDEGVGVAGGWREEESRGLAGDVGDAGELAAAGDDAGGAGCRRGLGHGAVSSFP